MERNIINGITVVCSSQHDLKSHEEHIKKTSGLHNKIEFLGYKNNGEFSLTEIYNKGLSKASNDIVVFLHHDLTIETKQWGKKLLKTFEKNPQYGILGVAGTKYMSENGQWWSKTKKMYGRVAHTHEGKTWLSTYSDDLGQSIEETVVVDGLFFAVDKTKIKSDFNKDVKGFHFYDVTFCFENYIKGVKIGVITSIRINHKSIGITNEQWETNRIQFSETFKDKLPVSIKRELRKGEKLNILIGCLSFANYTGSELYVFELAKQLIKDNCNVSICSNIGEPLLSAANKLGVKMYSLQEPPSYKLGDGKTSINTPNGPVVTQEGSLYKINNIDFDVIHVNHKPVTEHLLRMFPDTPMISSIHSEVISLEEPVLSTQIKKYIAIRPEIKEYIVNKFGVESDDVSVIYNPIDDEKFKPVITPPRKGGKRILFVGTIDYLRKQTIQELITVTKTEGNELWIVGSKNETYLDEMIEGQQHVKYYEPTPNVEKYIQQCDETAGILLGRTTIEGWMCGKKGWIYDIDSYGNILSKDLHDIPSDIDKFKSGNIAKEIIDEYKLIIE